MDRIRITGGRKLNGIIPISGAKNAALPLMIAGLLSEETLILDNVPRLADVAQLQRILGNHGVDIMSAGKRTGDREYQGQTLHILPPTSSTPPRRMNWCRGCARVFG
jgi:UDP-N-acetylglucosamine 1-carboxyvinyltransferase